MIRNLILLELALVILIGVDRLIINSPKDMSWPQPLAPLAAQLLGAPDAAASQSNQPATELASGFVSKQPSSAPAIKRFDSLNRPSELANYCRNNGHQWVIDEGRGDVVYCGNVVVARNRN